MTSRQSNRPCPSARSTFRDHAHPTDRTHVAADARCVARTKRRSCDSRSRSHPQIQPPCRTFGVPCRVWEVKKKKKRDSKQWKDFNRQAARVFEIRDPDGFRTRAALCLALLLLRRGRKNRHGPRPKQRELYERKRKSRKKKLSPSGLAPMKKQRAPSLS